MEIGHIYTRLSVYGSNERHWILITDIIYNDVIRKTQARGFSLVDPKDKRIINENFWKEWEKL